MAEWSFLDSSMIGQSPAMRGLFSTIARVASAESTILITGESGTGKELVAQAIHRYSPRKEGPLVVVNCGAIPSELLESELFGHVKGAFTGALQNKMGRFEQAQGGTLFLDEIGDLAPHLQVKLLRVLQEKSFEPVGSIKSQKTDVRIIAATHHNLEKAVEAKRFREDLYYRLNVIPLVLPPLRERPCDIPLLIQHFLQKLNQARPTSVSLQRPEVLDVLLRYDWPGNIRELENLMERLVVMKGEGEIELQDLPAKIFERVQLTSSQVGTQGQFGFVASKTVAGIVKADSRFVLPLPEEGLDLNRVLNQIEESLVDQALERTGGNRNRASNLLGLNRTTLVEKLKKRAKVEGPQLVTSLPESLDILEPLP